MSGAAGRRKGKGGEREFARIIGGHIISRTGESGPDVQDPQGHPWEVKRVKNRYKILYDNLAQSPGVERLAVRNDRQKWLVTIPLTLYLEMAGLEKADKKEKAPTNGGFTLHIKMCPIRRRSHEAHAT